MQSGLLVDGKLPVFVFPPEVKFYVSDQTTHKKVLTLYNPYDFAVRFKVLCTSPNKYTVVDPDGSIKPRCCVDIVVRHNAVSLANSNVTDKFRIQMQDHATKQVIGRRDVPATLYPDVPPDRGTPDRDSFETLPPVLGPRSTAPQYSMLRRDSVHGRGNSPNFIVLVTGVTCIIALLLPNEGEQSTIPIQLSFNLKLILAYVLGE
ncbi:hypothetical protein AAG570_002197 [Ranatra chinensis]|uniref:Motile sperm domain-containing protein 3 n=1 Tax=Ranatra chinensis TaxID=642074 RepID=A0ABD0Y8W1_9HEMI